MILIRTVEKGVVQDSKLSLLHNWYIMLLFLLCAVMLYIVLIMRLVASASIFIPKTLTYLSTFDPYKPDNYPLTNIAQKI